VLADWFGRFEDGIELMPVYFQEVISPGHSFPLLFSSAASFSSAYCLVKIRKQMTVLYPQTIVFVKRKQSPVSGRTASLKSKPIIINQDLLHNNA